MRTCIKHVHKQRTQQTYTCEYTYNCTHAEARTKNTCAWVVSQGHLGCLWGPRGMILRDFLDASAWHRGSLPAPLRGISGASGGFFGASGRPPGESSGHVGSQTAEDKAPRPFLERSWGSLGAPLGPAWGSLRSSWRSLGPFWDPLGPSWGCPKPSWDLLGRLLGLFGRSDIEGSEYSKNIRTFSEPRARFARA